MRINDAERRELEKALALFLQGGPERLRQLKDTAPALSIEKFAFEMDVGTDSFRNWMFGVKNPTASSIVKIIESYLNLISYPKNEDIYDNALELLKDY